MRPRVGYQPSALLAQLHLVFLKKFEKPKANLAMPRSMLVTGAIGCGKTNVLRGFQDKANRYYSCRFLACSKLTPDGLADLELSKDKPSLFILDDVDLLVPQKKAARPVQLYRFIDSLMASEQGHLIMTTSRVDAL